MSRFSNSEILVCLAAGSQGQDRSAKITLAAVAWDYHRLSLPVALQARAVLDAELASVEVLVLNSRLAY